MNKYVIALGMAGAMLLAMPVQASKAIPKEAGSLVVYGNPESKLFTQDGIDRAKSALAGVQFERGLHLTIDTYAEMPAGKKAAFAALGDDKERKAKFYKDWAHERATDEKAKGPFVLICRKPGHIEVLVDKQSRERGFTHEDETKLREILQKGFQEAKDKPEAEQLQTRDDALKSAVNHLIGDFKGTTTTAASKTASGKDASGSTGMGIGGWICIGVVVLVVIWVAIALFRALTGGGGGGGGMGGGGGGGGGFMSSMFGGLFGAMAGMWIYNSMFGGGSMFGGSDSSNNSYGDSGGDGGGDTGAGDYSGDAGSGGDFDGGGGDYGGGGDWGGGGDGGGGGDF